MNYRIFLACALMLALLAAATGTAEESHEAPTLDSLPAAGAETPCTNGHDHAAHAAEAPAEAEAPCTNDHDHAAHAGEAELEGEDDAILADVAACAHEGEAEPEAEDGHDHAAHAGKAADAHAGEAPDAHAGEAPDAHAGEAPDAHAGEAPGAHAGEAPGAHAGEAPGAHAGETACAHEGEVPEGVVIETAGSGILAIEMTFMGDIAVNEDAMAHVTARVPGIVAEIRKTLGDTVKKGDVLAVLESRELADAKAEYLAALERNELAQVHYEREEQLYQKKLSPESDYLDAKQVRGEARIALRTSHQKLLALGLTTNDVATLPTQPDDQLTRFEIVAPLDGTIIEKHLTMGEVLKEESEDHANFIIADLRTVWANLRVFPADLPRVQSGQPVLISVGEGMPSVRATIGYVGPVVLEDTRTALARVVITNAGGVFRPGLFVTGKVTEGSVQAGVCIPKTALQTIANKPVVFVQDAHGLEPRPVVLGASDATRVEIVSGVKAGDKYVTRGSFELKAKQITAGMDSHAGHGH